MKWNTSDIGDPQNCSYAILLLSMSLHNENVDFITDLWQNAKYQACIDGGLNYFHHLIYNRKLSQRTENGIVNSPIIKLPTFISGDFDSASPDLIELYRNRGVDVVGTIDQDETDFTKGLEVLSTKIDSLEKLNHVVVIADINSQRFDHIFGILQTLHKAKRIVSAPVVVISIPSIYWLLQSGGHTIVIPQKITTSRDDSWCGLIPVGEHAVVTTSGLKWNLAQQELAFGELVSTSNTYEENANGFVTVTTNKPLLWTMGWPKNSGFCLRISGAVLN